MNLLQMMKRLAKLQVRERAAGRNHPAILWAHELCKMPEGTPDEVAWCSSILNLCAALLNMSRSQSAAARSWIDVSLGTLITDPNTIHAMLDNGQLKPGNVVLIFKRGEGAGQLGWEVKKAPGHVALLENFVMPDRVIVCGGNQSNMITSTGFPIEDILAALVVKEVQ